MGRPAKTKKPALSARERGVGIIQTLQAMRVLMESPRRPSDLVDDLDCSIRSVHRILNAFDSAAARAGLAGLKLESRKEGREVFYRLSKEGVRKALGL